MDISDLILYRNFAYEELLFGMCDMLEKGKRDHTAKYAGDLVEIAGRYGLEGNLWHAFLALCLANNENSYSTACEIVGEVEGSINELALHDFTIFKQLFDYDLTELGDKVFCELAKYKGTNRESKLINQRIRKRLLELFISLENTKSVIEFKDTVTEFYREFGVGKYGLNKAFSLKEGRDNEAIIEPITRVEHIYLDDIVGYELQKQKLVENTEAFLNGIPANNVLLYGDAGTGKSSSVKAIVNTYYDRGLRIIEVYKHQFRMLANVLEQIKDRNYKYIIYMDDLSFEDSELEYKYLKAILEGGFGRRPDNVLIYATSNRRHLIRESFKDKQETDEDLHSRDTVQEKISLSARFGVSIYYGSPDKREFNHIVKEIAEKENIHMPEDKLFLEANKWELSHGGLSGRTARQFVTYLLGRGGRDE